MTTYNLEKLRVLVIDDSEFMIKVVKVLLEAMGLYEVQGVSRPTQAFDAINKWEPDIIICDQVMEPITGLELIKKVRCDEDSVNRFIPIILLTGHSRPEIVKTARWEAGADAVLVKPVSAKRLYDCIVSLYKAERSFVETDSYFGPERRVEARPIEGKDRRVLGCGEQEKDMDESIDLILIRSQKDL